MVDQKQKNILINSFKHGLLGGLIAGIIFAMTEMVYAYFVGGGFTSPLKMITSIPVQKSPMEITLRDTLFIGVPFHLVFSAIWGVIIATIVFSINSIRDSMTAIIIFSSLAGSIIWIINFYFFAPLLNVPWFTTETNPLQQLLTHLIAYGTVLGVYLSTTLHTSTGQNND